MKNHNLDDLINDDTNSKNISQKNLLILIGLVVTVLIMGIFLAKTLLGKPETPIAKKPDKELRAIKKNNAIKKSNDSSSKNNLPDELKPLKKESNSKDQDNRTLENKNNPPLDIPLINAIVNSSSSSSSNTTTDDKNVSKIQKSSINKSDSNSTSKKVKISSNKNNSKTNIKKSSKQKQIKKLKKSSSQNLRKNKIKKRIKPKKLFAKTKAKKASKGNYYIQIGSFKIAPSKAYIKRLKAQGYKVVVIKNKGMFKLRIGAYKSYNEAKKRLPNIKKRLGVSGFVVRRP